MLIRSGNVVYKLQLHLKPLGGTTALIVSVDLLLANLR